MRLGAVGVFITGLIPNLGSLSMFGWLLHLSASDTAVCKTKHFTICLLRVNFVDTCIRCVLGSPIFPILSWPLEENFSVVVGLLLRSSSCSWVSLQAGDGSHGWLWSPQQVKLHWTPAILLPLWDINRGASGQAAFTRRSTIYFRNKKCQRSRYHRPWQIY